jgi:hypothetical protein
VTDPGVAARMAAVACGDEITTDMTLSGDLGCDCQVLARALTVKDGATLDLNGHTVSCSLPPGSGKGIVLEGNDAALTNGIIDLFETNVQASGSGHAITNVGVLTGNKGIVLDGTNHTVSKLTSPTMSRTE